MDGGMTRDDIQRMAIEAGFSVYDMHDVDGQDLGISVEADDLGVLERFISLVDKETTSLCWAGALQADQQPYAWVVPPSNHIFRGEYAEHDAKREASCCGDTARAVPLYTLLRAPPAIWQRIPLANFVTRPPYVISAEAVDAARYRWLSMKHRKTLFGGAFTESEIDAAIDAEMLEAAKEAA